MVREEIRDVMDTIIEKLPSGFQANPAICTDTLFGESNDNDGISAALENIFAGLQQIVLSYMKVGTNVEGFDGVYVTWLLIVISLSVYQVNLFPGYVEYLSQQEGSAEDGTRRHGLCSFFLVVFL